MARTLQKTFMGFLSTAVFFAAFAIAGDVLIAALCAIATAIAQLVLVRQGTLVVLASLAIVLALTGATLKGEDEFALGTPAPVSSAAAECSCRPSQSIKAGIMPAFNGASRTVKTLAGGALRV